MSTLSLTQRRLLAGAICRTRPKSLPLGMKRGPSVGAPFVLALFILAAATAWRLGTLGP